MKIFDFNLVKGVALISILPFKQKAYLALLSYAKMLVTGCISGRLLFLVSKTYEPIIVT